MASASVVCVGLAILLLVVNFNEIDAGVRVARSPQFGGFSQAQASAQAGGGGFGPPPPYGNGGGFRRPYFGHRPRFGGGFGGPGPGLGGGSISISKSISISRGGVAQSSAGSSAGGVGK